MNRWLDRIQILCCGLLVISDDLITFWEKIINLFRSIMTGIPGMDLCNLWTIMTGIPVIPLTHTQTALCVINIAGDIFHKQYLPDSFLLRLHGRKVNYDVIN